MVVEINEQTLQSIKNPALKQYAQIYTGIYRQFFAQLKANGIEVAEEPVDCTGKLDSLQAKGAIFGNDGKSIHINWLSPACEACRKGVGSISLYLSLKCLRSCYYCFNPNQEDYERFSHNRRDCIREIEYFIKRGQKLSFVALTGGEPLLHKPEMIEFFQYVKAKLPNTHTRLYTAGDLLDETTLAALQQAGLTEIRFSIKLEDSRETQQAILAKIGLAKQYIPEVMVEMPVIPGTFAQMTELLRQLDELKISGINLLEFCFPYHNLEEFRKRRFRVKNPPYAVLYDYWYAGGLPVAQSETECLALLDFAITEGLQMGVHYCSLENKHTGQIYQQNCGQSLSDLAYLSPRDYFLKTAKVFGKEVAVVLAAFKRKKITQFDYNRDYNFLEFRVQDIVHLAKLGLEIGISTQIIEQRDDGKYLRELKLELADADKFDINLV